MRKANKVLALILALILAISMLPMSNHINSPTRFTKVYLKSHRSTATPFFQNVELYIFT